MRALRFIGIGLAVVVALAVIAGIVISTRARSRLAQEIEVPLANLAIPTDADAIERGRHQVHAVLACTACHGDDLGGAMFLDAPPMGRLPAPNLTPGPGTVVAGYTPEDWNRAIRHGVSTDGRGLLFMPSEAYAHLTDAEMADVVAYLETLEPIDRELAGTSLGPVTTLLLATGDPIIAAERIDHDAVGDPAPAGSDSLRERGAHLVRVSGCVACHGPDLTGGKVPGTDPSWPPAGNLTPHPDGLGRYTPETFDAVLRTGLKADGTTIDPKTMPWRTYARMTDDEVTAIWAYLRSLQPRPE